MKVIVKSKPVTFRRNEYTIGDEIDVPDPIGKNLIKSGACELPGQAKKAKTETRKEEKELKKC